VGAWIETIPTGRDLAAAVSRPAWARGLKLAVIGEVGSGKSVAPRVGAWIETGRTDISTAGTQGRAPRGRVD